MFKKIDGGHVLSISMLFGFSIHSQRLSFILLVFVLLISICPSLVLSSGGHEMGYDRSCILGSIGMRWK